MTGFDLGFPHGSDGRESICNGGDLGSTLGWRTSPGEGPGHPVQYPYLENPMDKRAWRAIIVHGITRSWTQWGDQHVHFLLSTLTLNKSSVNLTFYLSLTLPSSPKLAIDLELGTSKELEGPCLDLIQGVGWGKGRRILTLVMLREIWVFLWGASGLTIFGHLKICSGGVYAMHSCTCEQLCKNYIPCHIPLGKRCLRQYCRAMILGIILFQGKWSSHLSLFTPKWNVLMFLRTWP